MWLRLPLKLSIKNHRFIALQGILLFGINYWLIYLAEEQLTSAIVAVIFTSIMFFNMLFDRIFYRKKYSWHTLFAAIIGITGVVLLFWEEMQESKIAVVAIGYSFLATICASLGNAIAYRNSRQNIPLLVTLFWGMFYSSLFLAVMCLALGLQWQFDTTTSSYIISLLYLALFGSVLAFWSYIHLISQIGTTHASYVAMLIPLVALILSNYYEGLVFNNLKLVGITLLLMGSYIAITRAKQHK